MIKENFHNIIFILSAIITIFACVISYMNKNTNSKIDISTILSIFNIHYSYYGCGKEDKIYSFLRLRITKNDYNNCFSEKYNNKAKIRELHVYGRVNDTYSKNNMKSSQHVGFGKKLMYEAEKIAKIHQCDGLIVIAGVGTRNYYRKLNYEIDTTLKNHGEFMIKYI